MKHAIRILVQYNTANKIHNAVESMGKIPQGYSRIKGAKLGQNEKYLGL